ncbi:MAG TPA: GNAT family N-acetyltransferase [Bryobacteraceae bacterium]|jgi:CelD/BcsL family acetyltransferase involved in cellulose biosynthesis
MSPQTDVCFELLTDLDQLEALAPAWNRLLDLSPCNRAFSSPIWFTATCRIERCKPCVAVAWRSGQLVALLPIALNLSGDEACFPNSMCNYNDLVAAEGNIDIAGRLLDYARAALAPRARLSLRWLSERSICARAAGGCRKEQDYMFVSLAHGWEGFLASKSRNFRKSIGQALRRAEIAGIVVRRIDPEQFKPEQLPRLFLELHIRRFGEQSAFCRSSANRLFILQALPVLFREGRVIPFGLYEGDRCIGIDLSLMDEGKLCTWNGGYPPEAERWSPGKLLIAAGIHQAIEWNLREYDLLRGSQEWKTHWATGVHSVGRLDYPAGL